MGIFRRALFLPCLRPVSTVGKQAAGVMPAKAGIQYFQ
jgi:hypothetical protein